MTQLLGFESEPSAGNWSLVNVLDGFALDRKIRASGWNFFSMGAEEKAMFFGAPGAKKIENALKQILGKVKQQHFNSLEVTGIVARRFLGNRFGTLSACPAELLLRQCRGTADVPARRRIGERLSASPVRGVDLRRNPKEAMPWA